MRSRKLRCLVTVIFVTAAAAELSGQAVQRNSDRRGDQGRFVYQAVAFTTRFDENAAARASNIALAAGKIRGTILKPGDEFSFNNIVGERTPQAGFLPAPVLTPGGREVAVGGGVCQVASTLYNAALLAGLEITRRTAHSSVVPYLAAGRDATVAEFKDLRFVNPHKTAVLIEGSALGGRLVFRILSEGELAQAVRIETEERGIRPQEQDPGNTQLPESVKSRGYSGTWVRVWRIANRDGVETSREIISEDIYAPGHFVDGDG